MQLGTEPFEILIFVIMIVTLLLTAELEKLWHVAMSFVIFMLALSALFWILGAPMLAVFQLTIYAGTTGVILFAVLGVFPPEEVDKEEKSS
jgi:NADH:ubiquinone oxidoreductase subunit 6 (subunit J)